VHLAAAQPPMPVGAVPSHDVNAVATRSQVTPSP
jgi:hypothetical protein